MDYNMSNMIYKYLKKAILKLKKKQKQSLYILENIYNYHY